MIVIPEMLCHRHAGEADPEAGAGALVHLPEHQHRIAEHAAVLHLPHHITPLSGPLAYADDDRTAAMTHRDVVDQLLDQHALAHAGSAEQPDLAAADIRTEQVDDLDAGL